MFQSTNQGFSNSYVSLLGCAPWCSRNVLLHWPPARCECSISKPTAHPKSNHILIRQLELGFASEAPNKHLKHSALFRIRRQGVSWWLSPRIFVDRSVHVTASGIFGQPFLQGFHLGLCLRLGFPQLPQLFVVRGGSRAGLGGLPRGPEGVEVRNKMMAGKHLFSPKQWNIQDFEKKLKIYRFEINIFCEDMISGLKYAPWQLRDSVASPGLILPHPTWNPTLLTKCLPFPVEKIHIFFASVPLC